MIRRLSAQRHASKTAPLLFGALLASAHSSFGLGSSETVVPSDGLRISKDTVFEPGTYLLGDRHRDRGRRGELDGNGAVLVGHNQQGVGNGSDDRPLVSNANENG